MIHENPKEAESDVFQELYANIANPARSQHVFWTRTLVKM